MTSDNADKLGKAIIARDSLDELYAQAYNPFARGLHRFTNSLPISAIPLVTVWSLLVILLLNKLDGQVMASSLYLSGLVVITAICAISWVLGLILDLGELDDAVLSNISTRQSVFAFYPNTLLKKAIIAKGFAVKKDFRQWHERQVEILDNRIRDLKEANASVDEHPEADKEKLKPGARKFIES